MTPEEALEKLMLDMPFKPKSLDDYRNNIAFCSQSKISRNASPEEIEIAKENFLNCRESKLRFIFSSRPALYDDSPPGKVAPNGLPLWGERLLDFYFISDVHGVLSISTSSRMAKRAKADGEADGPYKTMMKVAEHERDPELIPPFDFEKTILMKEGWTGFRIWDEMPKENSEGGHLSLPEQWPPETVFEAAAYPKGWPTDAFITPHSDSIPGLDSIPNLEHYIPQHRLPKRLVVHDPSYAVSGMLPPENQYLADTKITYKLQLSNKHADRRNEDEKREEEEEARRKKTLELFLSNPHSSLELPYGMPLFDSEQAGSTATKPATFVIFPPRPPLKQPDEAHLYFSANHILGEGQHSSVYDVEMVVPRSWLCQEEMCLECVKEDVKKILEEEDGPNGERRHKQWDEMTGLTTVKKSTLKGCEDLASKVSDKLKKALEVKKVTYEGPYRIVHTRIKHQNLEREHLCTHLSGGEHRYPLTTRVRLAAKTSFPSARDLNMHQREAVNYQRFPKHFFEHWSGYNICSPIMLDPVPIGPIVPQFYGYYVPENRGKTYRSPILLLEPCGHQIESDGLSVDDRNECLSLGLRMNEAGWFHGSFWERNIVQKIGPLRQSPAQRETNRKRRNGYGVDWSFRLVDFGRSRHITDGVIPSWMIEEIERIKGWLTNEDDFN